MSDHALKRRATTPLPGDRRRAQRSEHDGAEPRSGEVLTTYSDFRQPTRWGELAERGGSVFRVSGCDTVSWPA